MFEEMLERFLCRRFYHFCLCRNDILNNQTGKFYARALVCQRNSSDNPSSSPPEPPAPELCCMSGCANCVWIEYAKELKEYYNDEKQVIDEALKKIEDPSFRSFISIEIKGQLSKTKK